MPQHMFIDSGMENMRIQWNQDGAAQSCLIPNNKNIEYLLKENNLLDKATASGTKLYVTGKLAGIVKQSIHRGEIISSAAALWSAADMRLSEGSVGIVSLSASGYMVIGIDKNGLKDDLLVVNPKCGAGTGINLNRILEKLNINRTDVDKVLKDYLGEAGREKRAKVAVRSDRCGVFSSSATISDKNQGIPLDYALAVTMKSEVRKACNKMRPDIDEVHLTGGVFKWQYCRDCAEDCLNAMGISRIIYDENQGLLIEGMKHLVTGVGGRFRHEAPEKLRDARDFAEYPSFKALKKRYEASGLYRRLEAPSPSQLPDGALAGMPVNMALDVGSTMAKMVLADMENRILCMSAYNNKGDTIETIKHIFGDLKSKSVDALNFQHIGITGSGRYQVQKILKEVYPAIADRIFVLVENYAHAYGSIEVAKAHIDTIDGKVNKEFCVLVDIGGEDTKVSVISLKERELFDNVMNIKCSAGTGSLMDTLKSLFGIPRIGEACRRAHEADRGHEINATCAVFLMENAKKMQALGYPKDEILASCNYAIVENMARTLWNQIKLPRHAVVLLHGQTMLSDPLPLAVTRRIQDGEKDGGMYCLVPPYPGHRACIGLIESMKREAIIDRPCRLDDFIDLKFDKRIVMCRGAACGDKNACCARTMLKSPHQTVLLGGCTLVNDRAVKRAARTVDAYKAIWEFADAQLPRIYRPDRVVIPRCFAASEKAFFLSRMLVKLGLPVHVDNVREKDVLSAQPLFDVDTCAPLIGAVGQLIRLAGHEKGMILLPQIDFLPTGGTSRGQTCTVNQGGAVIAREYAEARHPDARMLLVDFSFDRLDADHLAHKFYDRLQPLFDCYDVRITRPDLASAIASALAEERDMKKRLADKAADFIDAAMQSNRNVALVCAREYILNPGIYDSHIGRLLNDKGMVAIPSYALETEFDRDFNYVNWRNPHDILTKINAVANKRLNRLVKHERLRSLIGDIESGRAGIALSAVQVSTFRCGTDSVTVPTALEITKDMPSLFVQSDAMLKELAHLENRVNTHINQLGKGLHNGQDKKRFSVKWADIFEVNAINRETDVLCLPTMHDNRLITAVFKAAGFTVLENFDYDTYDIQVNSRLGRKHVGDEVCTPLAAIYGEMLMAMEAFAEKQDSMKSKKRLVFLDIKGEGPCRLAQYHKLHQLFMYKNRNGSDHKLFIMEEKDNFQADVDEWMLVQVFQSVVLKGVLDSLLLKYGSRCRDHGEFKAFEAAYRGLKQKILAHIERKARPNRLYMRVKGMAPGMLKYFGYGLHNNNGLRKLLHDFVGHWEARTTAARKKLNIHLDGEIYMRSAQVEDIFYSLLDTLGFNSFNLTCSPLWTVMGFLSEAKKFEINEKNGCNGCNGARKGRNQAINTLKKHEKFFLNLLVKPLYKAAGLALPHGAKALLDRAKDMFPTSKPWSEVMPYVGEAQIQLNNGTDLVLNVGPEGCLVSSMSQMLSPMILKSTWKKNARIQNLFSLDGGVDDELLAMSLLKSLGPKVFYGEAAAN